MKSIVGCSGVLYLCFCIASSICMSAVVYTETFDDGVANESSGNPQVCWNQNGATIPVSGSTPLCMLPGRALRTNGSTSDPILGVDLRGCTNTATLSFTYYQYADANLLVMKTTASSGSLSCSSPTGFAFILDPTAVDACTSAIITLTPGQINYIKWDHGTGTNYFAIDNLSIDATCPIPTCNPNYSSNFGSSFQSGTVCAIFPTLWENCTGSGPYIASSLPCGETGDYAMTLGTGYPYSSAESTCIDLSGISTATLSYYYSWNSLSIVSPSIEISVDRGVTFSGLKSSHDNTSGACQFVCIDLAFYTGNSEVVLRFSSNSSDTADHAYFDDILLTRNATCPSTPTPTASSTATTTPTITPTASASVSPTAESTDTPTDTPPPTDTPTETPTETATLTDTPTETPTVTPTTTSIPTETPPPSQTETPQSTSTPGSTATPLPVPSSGYKGNIALTLGFTLLIFLLRKKKITI